jgi:hypothetical protein
MNVCGSRKHRSGTVAVQIQVIICILNWNKLKEDVFVVEANSHRQQETVSCLTEETVEVLVPFGSTYLRGESGF